MKIKVDGKAFSFNTNPEQNLSEVILTILQELQKKHLIIGEITVDGEQLSGESHNKLKQISVKDTNILELTTCNPREVSLAILGEIVQILPRLSEGISVVASLIQAREEQSAMEKLEECLGVWLDITTGLRTIEEATGLNFEEIDYEGKSLTEIHGEILNLLHQSHQNLSANQLIELSDILEYEIVPRLNEESEALLSVIKLLQKKFN